MNKRTFVIVAVILILLVLGGGIYYAFSRDTFESSSATPAELSQEDIDALLERVMTHIVLPTNEKPLVATIVDVESLVATQPFYQGAENGDVLLIFSTNSKAIIYSPSRDIVVNVGPIIVDEEQQALDDAEPAAEDASDEPAPEETQE